MELLNNASEVLESLNLTLIYSSLVGLGIVCCGLAYFLGGDDGGGIGDGGDSPGLVISPTGIAFFTTSLGAYGLILYHGFSLGALPSMLISVVLSAITMLGFNYVFFKVFLRSGSVVKRDVLEGIVGEVYTAIPEDGTGEIIYRDSRGRQKSPARSSDGKAIATGTSVVIKNAVGATVVVEKADPKK
ncbi:NfeD family protein [bacterium]|nr:NfeD family protein [bacterium]